MNTRTRDGFAVMTVLLPVLMGGVFGVAGCGSGEASHAQDDGHDHGQTEGETPTNRIAIPESVRSNLGITFVEVEARSVEKTLRVPGRFEYQPTARREYRTMLPGRVELLVDQFARVGAGDALYTIDSPEWRDLQQALTEAQTGVERWRTRLASFGPLREAHRRHEKELERVIDLRKKRVEQLELVSDAGGGRVAELNDARSAALEAEADLAEVLEKEAQLEADESEARAELASSESRLGLLLDTAGAFIGVPAQELAGEDAQTGRARWRSIGLVTVRADEAGVVETIGLTNGAWADEKSAVLTVARPDMLRFRGVGLQSDLARLRDGLPARVVAPSPTRLPGSVDLADAMRGELTIGLSGDADDRTIELFMVPTELKAWARPGVSAPLEIVTDPASAQALAIPKACVQRDGLVPVIFRRDPKDPDKAIRVEADLGTDDGRWIVVNSGLRRGDEVVLDGAFQLMLASAMSGSQQQGGHFHADGTFHSGEDE